VLLSGIVAHGDGAYSFDCAFRNLSATGARVVMGKNIQFPSQFFLINIRDRVAYEAQAVWNDGAEAGVIFKKVLPLAGVTDPSLTFLKRLWMSKATG